MDRPMVLLGGGHPHVEVIRQLGQANGIDHHVILVSPSRHAPYLGCCQGMLAGITVLSVDFQEGRGRTCLVARKPILSPEAAQRVALALNWELSGDV